MRDCWAVLGIGKTTDVDAVKKVYRELIKTYHPDTARSPEKIRHNTIKCARINEAFRHAVDYCNEPIVPIPPSTTRTDAQRPVPATQPANRYRWKEVVIGGASVLVAFAVLIGLPYAFFQFLEWFPNWLTSLSYDNPARIIISGFLVIPLGVLYGGMLSTFTMLPTWYIAALLENTRFSKLSFKIGWMLATAGAVWIVYMGGFHWPFEHRVNGYYAFLHSACRFVAWSYLPFVAFYLWVSEYREFKRIQSESAGNLLIAE